MNEDKILKALFDLPKVDNNLCSTYGSIKVEDLKKAIKEFNRLPDYNELLQSYKILNELEEWLNNEISKLPQISFDTDEILNEIYITYGSVLDKIKELKVNGGVHGYII